MAEQAERDEKANEAKFKEIMKSLNRDLERMAAIRKDLRIHNALWTGHNKSATKAFGRMGVTINS